MKQSKTKKLFLLTNLWFFLFLIVSVSLSSLFNSAPDNRVQAATSSTINFQARLLTSSGALVPDGYYNVEFKLYDVDTGGSAQWTESHYDSNGVTAGNDNRVRVVNGYLSVYLGSLNAFPSTINWDQEQWLTLNVGGTSQTATPTYDGEMTPRLKLSAVPYALTAGSLQRTSGSNELKLNLASPSADVTYTLQGASAGNYDICTTATVCTGYAASSGSGNYIQNGTSPQTADFNITGTGTVGGNFTVTGQQVSIQPASSLTSGQSNISQTFTNASSSGGTINGYNQSITISNTSSGSTTNGFNISLTDSSSGGLANINRGINISLSGSNSSRAEIGLLSTVTRGIALQAISSGFLGNGSVTCNGVNVGLGLCAGDSASSNGGAGIYGYTSSRGTSGISAVEGTGVYGISSSGGSGVAGAFYAGLKGITGNTANNAYTSMGVFGQARGGNGASIYGGYFTLNSSSSATAVGSALFASNSTTTTNILQLQDNTTDVFVVADGGNVTAAGDIAIQGGDLTTTATTFNLLAGATTAINIGPASNTAVSINLAGGGSDTGCTITGNNGNLTCSGTITGSNISSGMFIQDGNSFGATATLGTNDSNSLAFETAGTTKLILDTSGSLTFQQASTISAGANSLALSGSAVNINTTGTNTVSIGNSSNSANTVTLEAGTGASAIQIGNGATAHGIQIGTGAAVQTVVLGSTNTTSTTTIQGGTGSNAVNIVSGVGSGAVASGTINITGGLASGTAGSSGGAINITGGAGTATRGDGGNVTIQGGNAPGSLGGNGGNVIIQGGGSGVGTLGSISIGISNTSGITLGALNTNTTSVGNLLASGSSTVTTATTSGTGTNTNTVTFTGTTSFANNDVIFIDNAGQDYYTRIVSGGNAATVTVSPAVTFETGRTVTKYNIQNIGATRTDYTTLNNRFFQGYFLGGIVTGAGSTVYSDANISSTNNIKIQSSSSTTVQNSSNSTSAFQIQDSTGTNLFAADTSNARVNITGDVNVGNRYGNRLFSDNFESGTLKLWNMETVGDVSADTAVVRDGKYAAKINPSATDSRVKTSIAPNNTVYLRAWVNVTSQTSSNADLLSLNNSNNSGSWTVYRNSGTLQLWNNCNSSWVGTGGTFSTNQWYLIEMRVTIGAGTGTSQVWMNGTQVINGTSQNNCTLPLTSVELGDGGGRTFTAYVDDLSVDTVSNGTASSLNVDDSLHVGGTATFGNSVLIQNTLTVDSLMPATAGSIGNGTITTVDSTGDVGQFSAVAMGADGFARIAYYDVTNADLKFVQCTNTPCSTKVTTTVDSTGTVGQYAAIAMGADGFARISYYDGTNADLKFIQCTNASCSTRNTNTIDSTGTVGQYTDIAMGADGFARISYYDVTNADLKFAQCTNAACSTRNINAIDNTGVQTGQYTSIAMGSDGFARIAYYDGFLTNDLKFIQCTNAACSTRNTTTVDSTGNVGQYTDIAIASDGFARISYYDVTNADLKFAQCTNAACSTNNLATIESADSVGQYTSIAMGADGFARISYYDVSDTDLKLMTCLSANCSSNKISTLDFTANVGQHTSIAMGADGFARISYYDVTNADLKLAVEGNQGGSNIGSASAPFGAIYGTTLNVQGAAIFQQSVEIANNLSVNGNVYVKGNTDSLTYSANGTAGLTLTCSGGSSMQNVIVTGGIVTGGSCINASYARVYNTTNTSLTTGAWTTLAFNSETQDTDNYHSTSSDTSRLTAPSDGWYHVTAQVVFPSNATGARGVRIIKNGSTSNIIGEAILPANNGSTTQMPINAQVFLSAGEYIEMQPIQTSGGNLDVTALSTANLNPDTYFAISKVQSGGAGVSNTLQQGYDMGNTITTTDSRNILFNLADTTTDSNFIVNTLSGSTGKFAVQNAGADVFSVIPDSKTVLIANNLAVYGGGTGINGGAGTGSNSDDGGGGGGGIGNAAAIENGCNGDTGGQANDVSGLFAVVSGLGYPTTGPGAGFGTCPNINGTGLNHGGSATGFGSGGGGPNYYGGNGGNGLYGGGGGGAAGESGSGSRTGGSGGQGVAVFSPEGSTDVVRTSSTTWTVPGGVTRVKVWAIGAGGGGGGATSVNGSSAGGGGAGGVTYKVFDVTPGQIISYSLGTAGSGGSNGANGNAGGTTTITVGTVTLSATGGAGGVHNNASSNAGGGFSGGDTVSITGNLSATGSNSIFQNVSNSSSAFQINTASGNSIINVDTTGALFGGAGTFQIAQSSVVKLGNGSYIGEDSNGDFQLITYNDSDVMYLSAANFSVKDRPTDTPVFSIASNGEALFKNQTNASSAFLIENSTGDNLLNIDTATVSGSRNGIISIGTGSGSTATLLVLDNKSGSGDPTGTNGAMYYSTNTNTFRCFENSVWKDCLSRHVIELGSDVSSSASTSFQNITGLSFSVTSGVNYRFEATLAYTASANTIGLRGSATGPASPTLLAINTFTGPGSTTGGVCGAQTCSFANYQNTYDSGTTSGASIGTTAGNLMTMNGFIRPSSSGTFQLRFAPETATSGGIVIKAGSTLEWW